MTSRFSITHDYKFSNALRNRTSLFYFSQDLKNVSAGADGNSESPSFGIRSVFDWTTNLSNTVTNNLTLGTEIQQSRSLATSWRFDGTVDATPLKVQDISKGSYLKTISNQYAYFAINRTTITPLDLTFIVGISANDIDYSRSDLLAGLGLVSGYNKDVSFSKSFTTSYNPHIAIQKIFGKQIINLSYSEGYNAPTASSSFIGIINKVNDNLSPEKAKMIDFGVQGLLLGTKIDYQISLFTMDITSKLTQLSGVNPAGGTYTYFANTGNQKNQGIELSVAYTHVGTEKSILKKLQPFLTYSNYDFTYTDFKTKFGTGMVDYSSKKVVGVPTQRYTLGLDVIMKVGLYMNNTYNMMGDVFTDFANTNSVKGYSLLNSKVGYQHKIKKVDVDIYLAANNLTNQINYTFLFLGNSVGDSDPGSGYTAGVATDINPGPSKAYYFGGMNVKFHF